MSTFCDSNKYLIYESENAALENVNTIFQNVYNWLSANNKPVNMNSWGLPELLKNGKYAFRKPLNTYMNNVYYDSIESLTEEDF